MTANTPATLKYTKTHEWIREENDGSVTVGITDHAQALLGDMVFVELPTVEKTVAQGNEIGVVESVKAASDIYSPVSGKILACNAKLQSAPELVNTDPYGEGWICKLMPNNADELKALLSAEQYQQQTTE